MDRSRQQYSRNQRMNTRNSYQQSANCGPQKSRNVTMDCDCEQYPMNHNQFVSGNVPLEKCPEMVNDPLEGMPLAMAYVPWQKFCNLYDECEAIYKGTIFRELDLHFYGMRCE